MANNLYDRIIGQGTINEPEGKPDPQFALPSTVNWMHALSLLTSSINWKSAISAYAGEGKRNAADLEVNTVLEQLFLSLHHLSALEALGKSNQPADVSRIAILAWYYGLTNAASAMIAAKSGSFQEDHSGTARVWDHEIAKPGLAIGPFGWRVTSLIQSTFGAEVAAYGVSSTSALQTAPSGQSQAEAAAAAYLSGSAKWYAWKVTEEVRGSKDFKALGVDSFRTKAARELRDNRLKARSMGFMHQAIRYRGKANYREALFLGYGSTTEASLQGFVAAQADVLRAFLVVAGAYSSRKLGKAIWDDFIADVEAKRAFTLSPSVIWT